MTNAIILSLLLTNYSQKINIPIVPYGDKATMSGYFDTKDTNNLYGIELESFDSGGNLLVSSWVSEHYVPPMTETTSIFLPPNADYVVCNVFGPNLAEKWSNGKFELSINQPKLVMQNDKTNFTFGWFDPYNAWTLQESSDMINWTNKISYTNLAAAFRLKRDLLYK